MQDGRPSVIGLARKCAGGAAALFLMSCGPSVEKGPPPPPPDASSSPSLAAIEREWQSCRQSDVSARPVDLQECDEAVIEASDRLVQRSPANDELRELLADLFEPFMHAQTGGEDALAARVVITATYAEFAQRRAAILTGSERATTATGGSAVSFRDLLGRHADPMTVQTLERRWSAIRDADCAAYQVPNCQARLESAFHEMTTDLTSDR